MNDSQRDCRYDCYNLIFQQEPHFFGVDFVSNCDRCKMYNHYSIALIYVTKGLPWQAYRLSANPMHIFRLQVSFVC